MSTTVALNGIQFMSASDYKNMTTKKDTGTLYFVEDEGTNILTAPVEVCNIVTYDTTITEMTLDCSKSNIHEIKSITGNFKITLNANCDAGNARTVTLILHGAGTATSNSVTFTNKILWPGGITPIFTTGVDIITLVTTDAGTTWYGSVNGLNY